MIVRPTFAGARLGMFAFWIWHYVLPLLSYSHVLVVSVQFRFQFAKRSPPLIRSVEPAGALALIQICAAIRAQALAFFCAKARHRQRQFNLLAHDIIEINRSILVEADRKIVGAQFFLIPGLEGRQVEKLKRLLDGNG